MSRENQRQKSRFKNRVVSLRRVSRMQAGGRRLAFSAMVVIGDNNGTVGVAVAKGASPKEAIEKGIQQAEKKTYKLELVGDTIPHEIEMKFGAAQILMRPASPGTGVIAGDPSRALLELAGVRNAYAKQLGTGNIISNVYCTLKALRAMRNGRVLRKMTKMQDRIKLKKELDKKERDMYKRLSARRNEKKKKKNRNHGYQRPRNGNRGKDIENNENGKSKSKSMVKPKKQSNDNSKGKDKSDKRLRSKSKSKDKEVSSKKESKKANK